MNKTLDIDCVKTAKENIGDLKLYGDGDTWKLLCKASSKEEGWMKSTKAMIVPNGVVIQVTTQQGANVSESVCFVPGVRVKKTDGGYELVGG